MIFNITNDGVLYLYPYYSLNEKNDEKSKEVYQVFKKNWDTYLPGIRSDLFDAVENLSEQKGIKYHKVAVTIMPSHSKGEYGENLLKIAHSLAVKFGYLDATNLIQRTVDKTKSTEGGQRAVRAHLPTLGLHSEINKSIDIYIILDDITTTGSSLEAARQLLIGNGVEANHIIKIAVAKTMHDDIFYN